MVARLAACAALSLCTLVPVVAADEIHLKNGDRLSGRIVSEEEGQIVLEHEAAGTIAVEQGFVERVVREEGATAIEGLSEPVAIRAPRWERELSLGYNRNRGNTIDEALSGTLFVNRKTGHDEVTLQTDGYYSETDRRMTAQRYNGMVRYAFSFGPRLAWYNFYALQGEHDRFANVDRRLTPSTGLGYWFSDEADWKAMVEAGFGWERTNFRDTTGDRSDMVLVPRAFAYKTIFGKSSISQDVTVWPNLSDLGAYRLRSETALTSPLNEDISLRVTLIDEFQSDPARDTKRNDARFVSSLVYSF